MKQPRDRSILMAEVMLEQLRQEVDGGAAKPNRCYLGDAVYAEVRDGALVLTTEDGIKVTNTIVLEPEVLGALLTYLEPEKQDSST